jgi:hypothetical protein
MDFIEQRFSSESIRDHATASSFLQSTGADGYVFLPRLLSLCKAVDLEQSTLSRAEKGLVSTGARSLGMIVYAVGYNDNDMFHREIAEWLLFLTYCEQLEIASSGIHALGDLGVPLDTISSRLRELIEGDRLPDEIGVFTRRAFAFRNLAKIDRELARPFLDSEACREFVSTIHYWSQEFPENISRRNELLCELQWLRI